MNRLFLITVLTLIFSMTLMAQKRRQPVQTIVSEKEVVQSVYPDAEKVEKLNDYWYKILNSKNKTIGLAMSSMKFCTEVRGYCNTTPVLIITDTKMVIRKIALLTHWETPGYVRRLENSGFFALWNNKTLKDAQKVVPDAYTGATMTAMAVSKNVSFLLENGLKNKPKNIRG